MNRPSSDTPQDIIREETALHQVARDLATAQDVPEVLRRIADLALAAASADACYLERVDLNRREVEVIATAGTAAPAVGARVPYPGSLAEDVIERDEPEIVSAEAMRSRPIAGMLSERCLSCTALVVPLFSERQALGAMILLRGAARPAFAPEEMARMRVLADLAALALRRVLLQDELQLRLAQVEESEQRFRLLVESVRDYAIFMLDPEGHIASWNQGAARINGYDAADVLGRHFSLFYPEEDRVRRHPEYELAVAAREGRYEEEGWRVRSDGSRFWSHVLITAVRNEAGELIGFAKVTRDLSERRRIELELRQSRERYRALYEENPTIYITTDAPGKIVEVNRFGAGYLGYTPAELIGWPVDALVHEADQARFNEHVQWCLAHPGEVETIEFRKYRRDGTMLWVREAGRAVQQADGRLQLLNACEDITERVQAEQALRESEELFRQIAGNIREALWVSDPGYTQVIYISPAYEEIWGRPVQSLYEDPYSFIGAVHPEDRERVAAALPSMASGFDIEYRVVRPDGGVRWVHARGYPVLNEHGEVYRAVGVGEDVTERKLLLEREREAREQATSILERITDAFFALDEEWRFTFLNPGAAQAVAALLQRDPGEVMGMSFWDAVPQFRGTRFEEEYRRALETQTPVHFEEYAPVFGVWFEVHAYPSPAGLSVYFRDVTARRRAEEERARLLVAEQAARAEAERRARDEEALRRAAEAVGASHRVEEVIHRIATSAVDATQADGAFVERFDLQHQCIEVVAAAGERVPPLGSATPYPGSAAERAVQQQEPVLIDRIGEAEFTVPDHLKESCSGCSAAVIPLTDEENPLGALVLLRSPDRPRFDPERLSRAETFARLASLAFRKAQLLEQSERRRRELEEVMESRAHLMRGFSHDVKNPLGAADGHLALLEDGILGELEAKQRDSVVRVRRSIRSALALINDLVELARAEAGQIEIHPGPLNAREAALEMAEEYRPQAQAKELGLETKLPRDLPVVVSDGVRVRQILGNLLSNGVKYTPEGGSITLLADSQPRPGGGGPEDWITLTVRDTGPGIPAEKQEEIFREFTRLEPAATPGAGLGLAISRRIAQALGGDITVESAPGGGASFTLWLPCTKDPA